MTGILAQLDILPRAVVLGISRPRIPVMVKSRAYPRPQAGAKIKREIPHFIRQWRERKTEKYPQGMSQEELRDLSGVSVSSISAYERGKNDPSLEALAKLSRAIGVPRGMLTDVNPEDHPQLWDAYLRADNTQRDALSRMAAGLVEPPTKPARKR